MSTPLRKPPPKKTVRLLLRVWSNPGIRGGEWCFAGTRVPLYVLGQTLRGEQGFMGNGWAEIEGLFREYPDLKRRVKVLR